MKANGFSFRINLEVCRVGFAIHENGGWIRIRTWSACLLRSPQPGGDMVYRVYNRFVAIDWGTDGHRTAGYTVDEAA